MAPGPGQNCQDFVLNDILCIDCPASASCRGPQGVLIPFEYVDGNGDTICTGQMARAIVGGPPNACIACPPPGMTGYQFT